MWASKPAKRALHELFMQGDLMVVGRSGFQRIYDLTERVLPAGTDTRMPSSEEFADFLIYRAVRAHGLVSDTEITYLRKGWGKVVRRRLDALREASVLIAVQVGDASYHTSREVLDTLPKRLGKKRVSLISPFDNAVIQRKRLSRLFGFDYQIEIYVPAHKRVHGYFCMPVLWGDRFVGRIDPKADRKSRTLIIKNTVLEHEFEKRDDFLDALAQTLQHFARFNGCDTVEVVDNSPANHTLRERIQNLGD